MSYPNTTLLSKNKTDQDSLKVKCISSLDDFTDLKKDWNSLWRNSRESHPFISWEWMYTWWEIFANDKDQLMIISVYEEEKLIGIAPFYIKQYYFDKALMFIGEGELQKEAVASHYLDLICEDENSETVIDSVVSYLENHISWSHSQFSFVLDKSYLFTVFAKLELPMSFALPFGHQYKVSLKDSFDDLYSGLGKSTRKLFRLKRNRMKKQAPLELVSLDVENEIESSLDTLETLHAHRQKVKGQQNVFSEPRFKEFHLSLINRLKGTGNVHIRALKHGEDIIACTLNYVSSHVSNRSIYSYASGFKSSDDNRFSPMFVFDILDFEHSINNKYKQYDLLSADDSSSYKDKYKAEKDAVSRLYWFTSSPLGVIRFSLVKSRYIASNIKSKLIKLKA